MEQKKLEETLAELHPQSFAWALRCCFESKDAAEEVLQNTYLKILEGKAKYATRSSFKTWLFSVIRFTAIDFYQANKKRSVVRLKMNADVLEIPDDSLKAEIADQSILFRQALAQLSPKQSNILHLVFYQDCTIAEAADIMNIPLGTARTHYKRGKLQLKKMLTENLSKDGFLKTTLQK